MNTVLWTCDHCHKDIGRHEQARVVFEDGHRMFVYHVKPDCCAERNRERSRIENLRRQEEWHDA